MARKVLIITNMYPGENLDYFYQGNFIKEQIESIRRIADINFEVFVIRGFVKKSEYLNSIRRIKTICDSENFDAIHVHYGLSGLFLLNPTFPYREKTVLTLHGGDILKEQGKIFQVPLVKLITKCANQIILVDKNMQDRVPRKDCHIIPCGIDLDFFSPGYGEKRNNVLRIAFGGNPDRAVKDYSLFVATIEKLRKMHITAEPVVIHEMTKAEVRASLCSAHCLLLTSKSEGSPQIVKEAIACGTPVISVDVGDVASILENTNAGKLVPYRDPSLLSKAVIEWKNRHNLDTISEWRRSLSRSGYDLESVAKKIVYIYDNLSS